MCRLLLIFFLFFFYSAYSQTPQTTKTSPYELNWKVDGPYLGASIGLNVLGFKLIQDKKPLTEAELNALSKNNIFFIDRWGAGKSSDVADDLSYIPFYGSFALPLFMIFNENERNHAGQISILFLETMATAGALFTISAGAIQKSRPLVYNTNLAVEDRVDNDAQRSFFAGHVAAAAAATFFTAKVFSDFNPQSWAKPYIWTAAVAIPVWVGYLRIESGKHFLTDNIIGLGVGALSGILIPEFHKKKNERLQISPGMGFDFQGLSLRYSF